MIGKEGKLPSEFQAVVLTRANAPLKVVTHKLNSLAPGEVWVKVKAAPINPSDLAMLAGTYPHQKSYPFTPGLEASGIVVASGGGFIGNYLLGKRVACSPTARGNGTWAEYIKTDAGRCVPLSEKLNFRQGATTLVNPLTAMVLLTKVQGNSFVNTAAAGALGKMLIALAAKKNLTSINIVRNASQARALQAAGASFVLDAAAPDFELAYQEVCKHHHPTTLLDAVGGNLANQLLQGAPNRAKLIAYANLSRQTLNIAPQEIIQQEKTIEGFHLGTWLEHQSPLTKLRLTRKAQKLLAERILATRIYREFSLAEINQAIVTYQQNMSLGKWLLVP